MVKCAPYSGADLSTVVTFQRLVEVADGAGGASKAWQAISGAPTRAMVRPLGGRERPLANRTDATLGLRVVVRYTALLREADTVIIRGRRCAITAIADWEFKEQWTIIDAAQGEPV
jgi:SPP1 family predicted phage head-tail adaptor